MLPLDFLVNEDTHNQAIDNSQSADLGSGSQTDTQDHDQTEGHHEAPECLEEQLSALLERSGLAAAALVAALLGGPGNIDHHQSHAQQAGSITGSQHLTDGSVGHHGVDDQAHSGRNDGGQQGGSDGNGAGVFTAVAAANHFGNQDLAVDSSVSGSGAGAAALQDGKDNVNMSQTAGQMAAHGIGKVHKSSGQTGVVHNNTGGNKQGDRQQRIGFRIFHELLHNDLRRHHGLQEAEVGDHTYHKCQPDGHTQHCSDNDTQNRNENIHTVSSSFFGEIKAIMS